MRAALLVLLGGCADDPQVAALAEVSQQLSFESVDQLGPHHFLGSLRHERERSDGSVGTTDEAVEIRWQDWDSFEYRRTVDSELESAVIARDGVPWALLADGSWREGQDAEPHRLELRQSWNAWDQALEPYRGRIDYTDRGTEVVEGRNARRYGLSLAPLPAPAASPAKGGKSRKAKARAAAEDPQGDRLVSISGEVWVDEATAVRLLADVTAARVHRGRRHTVTLKVVRSDVGRDQKIQPPPNVSAARQRVRTRPGSAPPSAPPNPNPEGTSP